jgi:Sortase and related acyltransferases
MKELKIRFADPGDAETMLNVYAPYVRDTAITFEYEVPSVQEFAGRVENVTTLFPWLICESADGGTAGYAYASRFRPRAAFQWDAEVSVYLSPEFHRGGIGSALYGCMEAILLAQGYRNLYALITHPNAASEGFHRSKGYCALGIYHKTGFKFGKWHDLIVMEKQLAPLPENPEPCRPYTELDEAFLSEQLQKAEEKLR